MSKIKRIFLVLTVILACAGCDQSTKYLAANNLEFNKITSFAGDTFRLHYVENTGAFLGMGDSLNERQRFIVFTIIVSLVLGAILVYTVFSTGLTTFGVIAYSIILGGGLSNLYDRIINKGAVVDFLNIGIGELRTGVFNVADVFIMIGVVMLLVHTQVSKRNYKSH